MDWKPGDWEAPTQPVKWAEPAPGCQPLPGSGRFKTHLEVVTTLSALQPLRRPPPPLQRLSLAGSRPGEPGPASDVQKPLMGRRAT